MFGCDLGAFTWLCDPHRNDFDVMYFSTCRLGLTSLNKSYAQNEIFHKAIVSKVRSNIALGHLKRRGGVRRHENGDRQVVRVQPPLDIWVADVEGDLIYCLKYPDDLLVLAGVPQKYVAVWRRICGFARQPPEHLRPLWRRVSLRRGGAIARPTNSNTGDVERLGRRKQY